jgi:hypothetical protein
MRAWTRGVALLGLGTLIALGSGSLRSGAGGRHGLLQPMPAIVVCSGFVQGNLRQALANCYKMIGDELNKMCCEQLLDGGFPAGERRYRERRWEQARRRRNEHQDQYTRLGRAVIVRRRSPRVTARSRRSLCRLC